MIRKLLIRFVVDDPRLQDIRGREHFANGQSTTLAAAGVKRSGAERVETRAQQQKRMRNEKSSAASSSTTIITNEENEDNGTTAAAAAASKIFMFALRVSDGFFVTDVIAFDKVGKWFLNTICSLRLHLQDAEHLLGGITAAEFWTHEARRAEVAHHLQHFIDSRTEFRACLRKYLSVPALHALELPQRKLAIYDTQLFQKQ